MCTATCKIIETGRTVFNPVYYQETVENRWACVNYFASRSTVYRATRQRGWDCQVRHPEKVSLFVALRKMTRD
jgi:hypothetical protein